MHFKGGLTEAAYPVLGNLHGLNRADRNTQAAAAAFFSIRITSYNVCYTKLLRFSQAQACYSFSRVNYKQTVSRKFRISLFPGGIDYHTCIIHIQMKINSTIRIV